MTEASGLQMNVFMGQGMNSKYLKSLAFGIYSRRPPFLLAAPSHFSNLSNLLTSLASVPRPKEMHIGVVKAQD